MGAVPVLHEEADRMVALAPGGTDVAGAFLPPGSRQVWHAYVAPTVCALALGRSQPPAHALFVRRDDARGWVELVGALYLSAQSPEEKENP